MLPSLLPAIGLFYVNIHLLDRVVVCSVWGGARCLTSCHAALGDRVRGGGAWPLRCPWHTGDTVLTTAGAGAGPFPERPPGGVPSALPSLPPGSGGHPRGPGGGGLGEGVRPCAGAAGVRVVEWLAVGDEALRARVRWCLGFHSQHQRMLCVGLAVTNMPATFLKGRL